MATYEEMARLYDRYEQCRAEADDAYVEYTAKVAASSAAYVEYSRKSMAEHEARRVWMAAGETVFAA
ncbi:MAG: hypothetical protein ACRDT4_05155 [Micromonosporaceae bacterium]